MKKKTPFPAPRKTQAIPVERLSPSEIGKLDASGEYKVQKLLDGAHAKFRRRGPHLIPGVDLPLPPISAVVRQDEKKMARGCRRKLRPEEVASIRRSKGLYTQRAMAAHYGVSVSTIRKILKGDRYRGVGPTDRSFRMDTITFANFLLALAEGKPFSSPLWPAEEVRKLRSRGFVYRSGGCRFEVRPSEPVRKMSTFEEAELELFGAIATGIPDGAYDALARLPLEQRQKLIPLIEELQKKMRDDELAERRLTP